MIIDRAAHPIQETARNLVPRPAGGHLRRRVRLPRAALRQGADDPRVRPAAGRRHRRHLPLLASSCRSPTLGIREYRSPTKGRRLPRGPARAPGRVARLAAAQVGAGPRRRQHRRVLRRAWPSRASSTSRPIPSSGSTRSSAGHQGHPTPSRTRSARRASWASSSQTDGRRSRDETVAFVHDFTRRSTAATRTPSRQPADGVEHRQPPSDFLIEIAGRRRVIPPTGEEVQRRYEVGAPRRHPDARSVSTP